MMRGPGDLEPAVRGPGTGAADSVRSPPPPIRTPADLQREEQSAAVAPPMPQATPRSDGDVTDDRSVQNLADQLLKGKLLPSFRTRDARLCTARNC